MAHYNLEKKEITNLSEVNLNNKSKYYRYKEMDFYSASNQNISQWYNSVKTLQYNPRPEATRHK